MEKSSVGDDLLRECDELEEAVAVLLSNALLN